MSLEGSLDVAHLHNGAQMQAQKDLQSEHTNYGSPSFPVVDKSLYLCYRLDAIFLVVEITG